MSKELEKAEGDALAAYLKAQKAVVGLQADIAARPKDSPELQKSLAVATDDVAKAKTAYDAALAASQATIKPGKASDARMYRGTPLKNAGELKKARGQ